VKRE
jgi:hypothetical protein